MYVIHPFIIYLMSTLDDVKSMFGWFIFLSIIALITMGFLCIIAIDECRTQEGKDRAFANLKKRAKRCIASFFIFSVLWNITPSKSTMMQMAAASLVTVENVQASKEIVGKVYEDIIGLLKSSTETPKQ